MDIVTPRQRSEIMSKIKSRDSKIEITFRKALWRHGLRYLKNSTKYFGKPDIVLPKHTTVIFIDSCFWHGCSEHFRMPKTRTKFWREKIERNKRRDIEVTCHYQKLAWQVIRIWEHDLAKNNMQIVVEKVKVDITSHSGDSR